MTFEEQFPSLKEYVHPENHTVHAQQIRENCIDKINHNKIVNRLKERIAYLEEWSKYPNEQTLLEKNANQNGTIIDQLKELEKYKQKVKEAIDKITKETKTELIGNMLKNELGL